MKLVALVLRIFQIIFGIIVLGLSISLIKTQADDSTPAQTKYAAFCGAWAILIALVGMVGLFFERLSHLITAALDGLTALLLAAAGIALAVALGVHSCDDELYQQTNVIVRGSGVYDGVPYHTDLASLSGRCHQAQATTAFLFFGLALSFATAVMSCLVGRRSKNTTYA